MNHLKTGTAYFAQGSFKSYKYNGKELQETGMYSLENLRGIPKSINSEVHLSQIRKMWNKFYKENSSPTKQQLLDQATIHRSKIWNTIYTTIKIMNKYMYKLIEPEVAGSLGEKTQIDNSFFPPIIKNLHYEFEGWLGDDILESFPCYITTEKLRDSIELEKLTGISFDEVVISKSETFLELYPDRELPSFFWAKINGEPNKDDFFITEKNGLAISEKAYLLLKKFNIDQADIEDL